MALLLVDKTWKNRQKCTCHHGENGSSEWGHIWTAACLILFKTTGKSGSEGYSEWYSADPSRAIGCQFTYRFGLGGGWWWLYVRWCLVFVCACIACMYKYPLFKDCPSPSTGWGRRWVWRRRLTVGIYIVTMVLFTTAVSTHQSITHHINSVVWNVNSLCTCQRIIVFGGLYREE